MNDTDFQELIKELKKLGVGQKKWHWTRYISLGTLTVLIIAALSIQDWASRADERLSQVEQQQFTKKDAALLKLGMRENSKDIKENNNVVGENTLALYQLQRTIDRYIVSKERIRN